MVHGEDEAMKAQEGARALFSTGNAADMPEASIDDADFVDGSIDILTLLLKAELVPSKSEARRAVQQGGVSIDGEKITDIHASYTVEQVRNDAMVLKKGKKNFRKIV